MEVDVTDSWSNDTAARSLLNRIFVLSVFSVLPGTSALVGT